MTTNYIINIMDWKSDICMFPYELIWNVKIRHVLLVGISHDRVQMFGDINLPL